MLLYCCAVHVAERKSLNGGNENKQLLANGMRDNFLFLVFCDGVVCLMVAE